ncbi:tripartite tricarboxylate transporter substrate binding protein [Pseudodesulfovibrio cashew]|uniref:Tripartite tricarboxylate transporter substrate binding protein n=1 Tax=Pseudodesulfovibrio cashew TaxID=2678688 RepID=A0A6I6JLG9_9BACT|nr:tripartite tricarboxylate transporter substrate binding protein [Pseudodesulfovibrio cashew]QGY41838.1 tripartite tricarboxylate transporter substrate binding protein [Pseudodesulfovibrio cashew]
MRKVLIMCVLALLVAAVAPAYAEFPEKAVQIVVPWKPGGGSDISARIISDHMKELLPEPLVVTNIDGAAGLNGALHVSKARPDGYTVLWEHPGNLTVAPMVTKAKFRWNDFEPVGIAAKGSTALIVRGDSPFKTAKEALEAVKANPGKYRWALALNAVSHFTFLNISHAYGGLKAMFIPANGDKGRIVSLLGNNSDITTVGFASVKPYLKSGDLRVLAMVNTERSPFAPDVPTLKEIGVDASYDFLYSIFAPKGTPKENIMILSDAFKKALSDEGTISALREQCLVPFFKTPEETRSLWQAESDLYTDLAKENGLVK